MQSSTVRVLWQEWGRWKATTGATETSKDMKAGFFVAVGLVSIL
jgi:hypothetical protein